MNGAFVAHPATPNDPLISPHALWRPQFGVQVQMALWNFLNNWVQANPLASLIIGIISPGLALLTLRGCRYVLTRSSVFILERFIINNVKNLRLALDHVENGTHIFYLIFQASMLVFILFGFCTFFILHAVYQSDDNKTLSLYFMGLTIALFYYFVGYIFSYIATLQIIWRPVAALGSLATRINRLRQRSEKKAAPHYISLLELAKMALKSYPQAFEDFKAKLDAVDLK